MNCGSSESDNCREHIKVKSIKANKIKVKCLAATKAKIKKLKSNLIDTNLINSENITSTNINSTNITSENITSGNIQVNSINGVPVDQCGSFTNINSELQIVTYQNDQPIQPENHDNEYNDKVWNELWKYTLEEYYGPENCPQQGLYGRLHCGRMTKKYIQNQNGCVDCPDEFPGCEPIFEPDNPCAKCGDVSVCAVCPGPTGCDPISGIILAVETYKPSLITECNTQQLLSSVSYNFDVINGSTSLGERVATVMIQTAYLENGEVKREELSFSNKQLGWSLDIQRGTQFSMTYNINSDLIDKINIGEGAVQIVIYVEEGISLKVLPKPTTALNRDLINNNITAAVVSNTTSSGQYLKESSNQLFTWNQAIVTDRRFDIRFRDSYATSIINPNFYGGYFEFGLAGERETFQSPIITNEGIDRFVRDVVDVIYSMLNMNSNTIIFSGESTKSNTGGIYKILNENFSNPILLYPETAILMRTFDNRLFYMLRNDRTKIYSDDLVFYTTDKYITSFDIDLNGRIYISILDGSNIKVITNGGIEILTIPIGPKSEEFTKILVKPNTTEWYLSNVLGPNGNGIVSSNGLPLTTTEPLRYISNFIFQSDTGRLLTVGNNNNSEENYLYTLNEYSTGNSWRLLSNGEIIPNIYQETNNARDQIFMVGNRLYLGYGINDDIFVGYIDLSF